MPRKFYDVLDESEDIKIENLKDVPSGIEKSVRPKRRVKKSNVKDKKKPSAYNMFVKKHMATDKVKKLEPRDRMKYIGAIWKEHKEDSK